MHQLPARAIGRDTLAERRVRIENPMPEAPLEELRPTCELLHKAETLQNHGGEMRGLDAKMKFALRLYASPNRIATQCLSYQDGIALKVPAKCDMETR